MDVWDSIDAALLTAVTGSSAGVACLAEATGCPADVVKQLVHAHHTAGRLTQPVPGSGRWALTLSGRSYLARLTAATSAHTRKAA
jgi:hypothetical protein